MEYLLKYVGLILVGLIIIIVARQVFKGGFVTTAASGIAVLLLISSLNTGSSSMLGVNALTVSTATILGPPGVVGLLIAKLIVSI